MKFQNLLISGREQLLNRILGSDPGQALNSEVDPAKGPRMDLSLAEEIYQTLVQIKNLAISPDGGLVNYQGLVASPLYQSYRGLVSSLRGFDYHQLGSRPDKLAFWINIYNALVIDAVIQSQVQASVTESWLGIMGFFQKAAYLIHNQRFSLTDIEQGILRANRGFPYFPGSHFSSADPRISAVLPDLDLRIHFALNCASRSCPPISFYTPDRIDRQLDLAARNFVNNDLLVFPSQLKVSLSKIFHWYQADFGSKEDLLLFLADNLANQDLGNWIRENQDRIQIQYQPYNWDLNGQSDI